MLEIEWKILEDTILQGFFWTSLHNAGLFKDPCKNKNKEKVGHMVDEVWKEMNPMLLSEETQIYVGSRKSKEDNVGNGSKTYFVPFSW